MSNHDDEAATFAAALFGHRRQPENDREMAAIIFGGADRYTDADPEPVPEPDRRNGNHVPREGQHVDPPVDPNHRMRLFTRDLFNN